MEDHLKKILLQALNEDIGSGDITTLASIPKGTLAEGKIVAKADGVIAGINVFKKVFELVNEKVEFSSYKSDGDKVKKGDVVGFLTGDAASILTSERTALNFLQRMSGIATLTNRFAEKIKHTKAEILDTRKTAPGLRILDKKAVKLGGGTNHRIGLFDLCLIKDNHIEVAGSISKAVEFCKAHQLNMKDEFKIEVETKNLEEVQEALACNVDVIMLDNFNLSEMEEAVKIINGKSKVEASGNVNLNNVTEIAETGVDYISVGALTHSSKALDISLVVKLKSR